MALCCVLSNSSLRYTRRRCRQCVARHHARNSSTCIRHWLHWSELGSAATTITTTHWALTLQSGLEKLGRVAMNSTILTFTFCTSQRQWHNKVQRIRDSTAGGSEFPELVSHPTRHCFPTFRNVATEEVSGLTGRCPNSHTRSN